MAEARPEHFVITLLRHPTRLRRVPGTTADPLVEPSAEG